MITGLELILAVLPLLISTTEHHKKGLRHAKALTSTKVKNEQQVIFYYELYDELSLLENTLDGVLRGLPSRSDAEKLSPLTENEQDEVEKVLGASAKPFSDILNRLLRSLDDLVSEKSYGLASVVSLRIRLVHPNSSLEYLAKESTGKMFDRLERFKQSIDSGVATTTLRERFRFTRNERSRLVAMGKIREYNQKLERLLHGSLLPRGGESRPTRKRPRPQRLRRMSEPLYRKIVDKLSTACESHKQHEARLCLWSCCSPQGNPESIESLDMVVSVTDVEGDGSHWQESTIMITSGDSRNLPQATTVRFVLSGSGEEKRSLNPPSSNCDRRDIESDSLCALIQEAHVQKAALQIMFDGSRLWQVRSRRNSMNIEKQKDITLNDVLGAENCRIPLREKWILAVVLAHAALHGSDSPWLCEDLSKEHISFFKKSSSRAPDLTKPLLKIHWHQDFVNQNNARNFFNVHSSSCLLSLGILLLEIYLTEAIENQYQDEDLNDGEPNENTNLTTALRLLEGTEGELYEGYRAAIRACLEPDLYTPDDTGDFRKKVYERIVLPLERELMHGFHLTPEDLSFAPREDVATINL
ncbi:uncharacterized protein Z518_01364 [Rhinocladiella mackenziei CBS 650.93]|uniref:DUF7580 domain-containing protein n=1 Tax=Rhinocladiella mackenziei CBS 650.93 TaxID=1442369 RepID=A0A0D2G5S9_9EURO|nr:uncharacterized protein Z518_01364 [Rhinocladiella mackenziei CBS 650.93]KIX10282.1 hypothetical protein Z518_01364 [Rhinocladiella mackenziei CBS 650.93]